MHQVVPTRVSVKRLNGERCRVSVHVNGSVTSQIMNVDRSEYNNTFMRIGGKSVRIDWEN